MVAVVLLEFDSINELLLGVHNIDEVYEFIKEWGSTYLLDYSNSKKYSKQQLKTIIGSQLCEMLTRQSNFKNIDSIIMDLKSLPSTVKYNAKLVWANFLISKNELAEVALAMLSICPSEACVERSFSALADVHTNERNSLQDNIIEAEMNLKWNHKYINDGSNLFVNYTDDDSDT